MTDTPPEIEEIQISLFRSASVQKRLALAFSFSSSLIQMSKHAIAKANPGLTKRDQELLFVEYNYGKPLADKLRAYFHNKTYEPT